MNGYDTYDEKQPVTWFRGHPIYAAYLVVIVFSVSMIATTLAGQSPLLSGLAFFSERVLGGEIWRILTYGLVNRPSIQFVIDMFMMIWFGREVEKVIGGRSFLGFFACVYLITPLLYTLIGVWTPTFRIGQSGALAIFVAFAAYFPNVPVFFTVLARWAALILVGIHILMALDGRDFPRIAAILATSGFAFAFVRYQQDRLTLPSLRLFRRQPQFRVLPDEPKAAHTPSAKKSSPSPRAVRETTTSEMDALLDKIARSGMGSLTPEERGRLDAAAKAHTQRKSGR